MTGHGAAHQWRTTRSVRLAIVLALAATVFVVIPPAQAAVGVTVTSTTVLATEGGPTGSYTVELDQAPTADVTVTVTGDAQATPSPTTLTFTTTNWAAQTVTVTAVADGIDEASPHTGTITHGIAAGSAPEYLPITPSSVTVNITDGDPPPSLSIADSANVTEGGTASFTVTLSTASAQTVTVPFSTTDGTAKTADSDYTATSGTLTFVPGDTSETITVVTLVDGVSEPSEAFTVTLGAPTNATVTDGSGSAIILDGTALPSLSIGDAAPVTEGATASFTVTLSTASAQTVTVPFSTADGTAKTADSDYTATSGTLTFTAGQTSKFVTVGTGADTRDEPNETFTVTLGTPTNAGISDGSGSATILDNDLPPSLSILDAAVLEGGTASFDVKLSTASGKTVSVNYVTAPGTATSPADFTAKSGGLTFTAGTTIKTVTVATASDLIDEGANEKFTVSLSGESNAGVSRRVATGTITDDDTATLSISDAVTIEEGKVSSFDVTLSTPSKSTVTVKYTTVNGTAIASTPTVPGDYAPKPLTTLTFTPGGPLTQTVAVTTVDDKLDEATEDFTVVLSGATAPVSKASAVGMILDNDGDPGLSVLDAVAVTEGPGLVQLKFTVSLLPASGQAVSVNYATKNGTAIAPGDYTAVPTTKVTFKPGETTKVILVTVKDDLIDEIDETVLVNLSTPINAAFADPKNPPGVGTIKDNDNKAPKIDKFLITDAAGNPKTTFSRGETMKVNIEFSDVGVMDRHEVRVSWEDGTADSYEVIKGTGTVKRITSATHAYQIAAMHTITVVITDEAGAVVREDAVPIVVEASSNLETVGLVDPASGLWYLRSPLGEVTTFYYGNPGDLPFMGDWDGDGVDTPGLYRQSDGFVYLRNSNTQGIADIRFFFGNPGDIPIAGDFNSDGFDTVSIYRPSEGRVFIINALGANDGGLGAAELDYYFGNPGDKPFVGDFNSNGIDTVGLHRESTGLVYFRNSHTQGNADNQFIFGDPGDRLVAGDWTRNGIDTPALFRPSNTTMYFRHSNTQGNADDQFSWGSASFLPVAGFFGLP